MVIDWQRHELRTWARARGETSGPRSKPCRRMQTCCCWREPTPGREDATTAHVVADEFGDLGIPVGAVLGNHDYPAMPLLIPPKWADRGVSQCWRVIRSPWTGPRCRGHQGLGEPQTTDFAGDTVEVSNRGGFLAGGCAGRAAALLGDQRHPVNRRRSTPSSGHTSPGADRRISPRSCAARTRAPDASGA